MFPANEQLLTPSTSLDDVVDKTSYVILEMTNAVEEEVVTCTGSTPFLLILLLLCELFAQVAFYWGDKTLFICVFTLFPGLLAVGQIVTPLMGAIPALYAGFPWAKLFNLTMLKKTYKVFYNKLKPSRSKNFRVFQRIKKLYIRKYGYPKSLLKSLAVSTMTPKELRKAQLGSGIDRLIWLLLLQAVISLLFILFSGGFFAYETYDFSHHNITTNHTSTPFSPSPTSTPSPSSEVTPSSSPSPSPVPSPETKLPNLLPSPSGKGFIK